MDFTEEDRGTVEGLLERTLREIPRLEQAVWDVHADLVRAERWRDTLREVLADLDRR